MQYFGYVPRLNKCTNCGKGVTSISQIYFSIEDNGIKCDACKRQDKGALELSQTGYTSLVYILSSDAKKIFSFDVPKDIIEEIALLSQIYTNEKLEKEYKLLM